VLECDVLVTLNPETMREYQRLLKSTGLVIIDSSAVKTLPRELSAINRRGIRVNMLPAATIAERELGNPLYANMITLGTLTALTEIVTRESMMRAIENNIPPTTLEENLRAFQAGFIVMKEKFRGNRHDSCR